MQKKLINLFFLLAGILTLAGCDDEQRISYGKLPAAARTFIEHYFPENRVTYAEREKDDGRREYKAVLDNGTELQFDGSGMWESVDCKFSLLPEGIIPEPIAADIAARYPDAAAYKIERELGGYEIGLNNGLQAIYAADGTFVREEADL